MHGFSRPSLRACRGVTVSQCHSDMSYVLVFLGLRACRGVTVSQCHSDMSGDMCIPTHIATAMSVSRVRVQ